MSKIKTGLVREYNEKSAEEARQAELRQKYDIKKEDVVIVEKSNLAKFTVKTISSIIKIFATILIGAFAIIGLLCLLHPDLRPHLWAVIQQTLSQIGLF